MSSRENNCCSCHMFVRHDADRYLYFLLQILFTKLSPEMLCGEVQKVEVTLKNVGNASLTNAYIASTDAKLFTLGGSEIDKSEGKHLY